MNDLPMFDPIDPIADAHRILDQAILKHNPRHIFAMFSGGQEPMPIQESGLKSPLFIPRPMKKFCGLRAWRLNADMIGSGDNVRLTSRSSTFRANSSCLSVRHANLRPRSTKVPTRPPACAPEPDAPSVPSEHPDA